MMNLSAPRESRRGQSYNSPKYHIESRGVLKKIYIIGCILII
jgi:hypothetical protein